VLQLPTGQIKMQRKLDIKDDVIKYSCNSPRVR